MSLNISFKVATATADAAAAQENQGPPPHRGLGLVLVLTLSPVRGNCDQLTETLTTRLPPPTLTRPHHPAAPIVCLRELISEELLSCQAAKHSEWSSLKLLASPIGRGRWPHWFRFLIRDTEMSHIKVLKDQCVIFTHGHRYIQLSLHYNKMILAFHP